MPAPKTPNTSAATAANQRRGDETAAARLRAAGWLVVPPERITRQMEEAMSRTYTVEVQARSTDSTIWQAVAPAETIDAMDAEEAARVTVDNQNVIDPHGEGPWRIVAWKGNDASGNDAYVLDGQAWLDGQADIAHRADAQS